MKRAYNAIREMYADFAEELRRHEVAKRKGYPGAPITSPPRK